MPSTHLSLHYHIIFSTKNREPVIGKDWRERLHAFLGGAIRNSGGIAESVGGTGDHVHLLVGLRASHTLADVLRDVKSSSSNFLDRAESSSTSGSCGEFRRPSGAQTFF